MINFSESQLYSQQKNEVPDVKILPVTGIIPDVQANVASDQG